MSLMTGILFLFSPKMMPSGSAVRNGLVNGKKALSASVVMFLLSCRLSSAMGIMLLYASDCLNMGTFGCIIRLFSSLATLRDKKSRSRYGFSDFWCCSSFFIRALYVFLLSFGFLLFVSTVF